MEDKMNREMMNDQELEQVNGGADHVIYPLDNRCPACGNTKDNFAYGTGANFTIKIECSACKHHFLVNINGKIFDDNW